MFYKIEEGKFVGFYEEVQEGGTFVEISIEDWQGILDKQSQGEVILYNPKSKKWLPKVSQRNDNTVGCSSIYSARQRDGYLFINHKQFSNHFSEQGIKHCYYWFPG